MAEKQLTIKQNILWNSAGCLIYQACQWVITIVVVTLSHGYDNSGALAYAMAIGNVYYPIATYNMRVIQVSDVDGEHSSSTYVGFRMVTVVLAYIAVSIYLVCTTSSVVLVWATLVWLLFKADESFCSVYYGIDQKAMRMDYIGISQAIRGVLSLAAFSIALSSTGNILVAMASMFVSCVLVTILFDRRMASKLASTRPEITAKKAIEMAKKYWLAVVTLVCYGAVVTVARQFFEGMHGEEMLGIYAAVATPTVLIQVAASYIYSPLIGEISNIWKHGSAGSFVALLAKVLGAILGLTLIAVVLSELVGTQALELVFGPSIVDYAYLLTPAIIAAAVTSAFAFSFDVLVSIRKLKGALAANVLALAISAGASTFLIGAFFMNGINIAIIVSFGVGFIVCVILLAVAVMGRRSAQEFAA